MTKESEKDIEARLAREVKKIGGLALKHSSQFHRGMPDRIVLLPKGIIYFVELKSTGEKPIELQKLAHQQLRDMGFPVVVIDTMQKVSDFCLIAKLEMLDKQ